MEIRIKNKIIKYPIIQGGMGVGVSLGKLSGTVALNDSMGTISAVGIGYREEDFYTNTLGANIRALRKEIKKARKISKGRGLIGVNVMVAINYYEDLVKAAVEEGIDYIVSGAGLPLSLPEMVNENALIAPIVSGVKSLNIINKYWEKKYNRLADFVVLEGSKAGGHLGFKKSEIASAKTLEDLTREVVSYLKDKGLRIPLFVAGSVFDGRDLKKYRQLGATGIQIGTRFIATEEADVDHRFKELIVNSSKEDLRIVESPVGMMARAINNKFLEESRLKRMKSSKCINCLKTCNPNTTQYCISERLINSARGDVENGLIFSGDNIDRIDKITSVREIIDSIVRECGL